MKKEFLIAFQLSKLVIFEVNYYTLGSNSTPHFTTSSAEFCRSKKDFSRCGQSQESLLPKLGLAYRFYKKWDNKHLNDLTLEEYQEMTKDLEELKARYNFIEKEPTRNNTNISFYDLVEFSKQEPKKGVK